ncbi:MAG: hypothetical protein EOM24_34505 [Chloroflexia bacterium]|nr:hypothetical protein [Chloroflexia bacterium]
MQDEYWLTVDYAPGEVSWDITVTTTGSGVGLVTSDPTGIYCGAKCEASYAPGTLVTLTATADADSAFIGWDGDCSGTQPLCEVMMDMVRAVTATFTDLGGECAAETALSQRPESGAWLSLLDQVRDELLAHTPAGRGLIDAYYRHGDEVSARLRAEPQLAVQALHLLAVLRADLKAAAAGVPPTLDPRERALLRAFARQLQRGASPALARDLDGFLSLSTAALMPQ